MEFIFWFCVSNVVICFLAERWFCVSNVIICFLAERLLSIVILRQSLICRYVENIKNQESLSMDISLPLS